MCLQAAAAKPDKVKLAEQQYLELQLKGAPAGQKYALGKHDCRWVWVWEPMVMRSGMFLCLMWVGLRAGGCCCQVTSVASQRTYDLLKQPCSLPVCQPPCITRHLSA